MNAKHIFAAIALTVTAASALAQPPGTAPTRAAADKANMSAGNNYPVIVFQSGTTRAEVTAELQRARERGWWQSATAIRCSRRYPAARPAARCSKTWHRMMTICMPVPESAGGVARQTGIGSGCQGKLLLACACS